MKQPDNKKNRPSISAISQASSTSTASGNFGCRAVARGAATDSRATKPAPRRRGVGHEARGTRGSGRKAREGNAKWLEGPRKGHGMKAIVYEMFFLV